MNVDDMIKMAHKHFLYFPEHLMKNEKEFRKKFQKSIISMQKRCRNALEIVEFTVMKMARGGIYDHIGGGFHRYAVEREWHIPHFEKMLYDQAQILSLVSDLYVYTRKSIYAKVSIKICIFLYLLIAG